ncbi:Phage integrase family protein [Desulfonispora thiosulfatigenes DSM 11270]|uniref:Phage integrase family protein n=1 Tax=Desulfonispora thiosulfatigenes DSM 11270 TaxID=656914 RepID=A0A1W1VQ01_DESTI|nr:site-specific integrase [Desulfonispora thiosulfatigenes]SMB95161.1 Phage integrase family protein [Desulfonispora thiosulfatigenes DSM 11270]
MELVQPIREIKKIETIKKILLANETFGSRNHLLFVLGINSGLRISDLLKLKIKDIMNKGKVKSYIELRETKTSKIKKFPVNKASEKAITRYITSLDEIKPEMYLFKSRKGDNQAISRVQAWEILNAAAKEVGITEPIGTHSLRKTFGYHAYQAGIDITLLQKIYNHSAPSITLRYIGITQDDIDNVYINLNL